MEELKDSSKVKILSSAGLKSSRIERSFWYEDFLFYPNAVAVHFVEHTVVNLLNVRGWSGELPESDPVRFQFLKNQTYFSCYEPLWMYV